jgi:hypothetical protein
MIRCLPAALALSAVFLAACGTTPTNPSAPGPPGNAATAPKAAAEPAAAPTVQRVAVPAASTRKVVLNMTGPKTVVEAKDWSSFKEEWRATFADHAKASGIVFSMQDGEARPAAEAGTMLNVYVNDYRQVGIGARIFLGIMSGNAFIDSKVAFADLKSGARFGEQSYNTTSSAWHGVFASMTPQQVNTIATEVFASLKAR